VSLFGGTTPLMTAWLVDVTHNLMMPAYYMMGAAVIGIVSVVALAETARKPLKGSPPAVATHREAHQLVRQLRDEDVSEDVYDVVSTARA
jgi:MHS family proline/betaine transporter-like MFS transporter